MSSSLVESRNVAQWRSVCNLTAYSRCVWLTTCSCLGSAQFKRTAQAGYISWRVHNGLYKKDIAMVLLSVYVCVCECACVCVCAFGIRVYVYNEHIVRQHNC